jgi:cellulose synthase/poly-beta-1,6-N-acetylglucosamine synthase-like glycosyltransferase
MSNDSLVSLPTISVILPIRNEERFIAQTLQYLQSQDYPIDKLEILVVDGESSDNTVAIVNRMAASDSRIRLLSNPVRLSSAARALGASRATGDVITFVDGHTYIDNDQLLKNTARLLAENNLSVLSRPQFLDTPENSFFQKAVSLARKSPLGHGLDSTIYMAEDALVDPTSSGATYRREIFAKVGNFDERFDACEDVEFNYRVAQAGYQSFTSKKLAVYYYPRESLNGLFKQLKRYGVGRFRLARKHPATLSIGTLIPPLFVGGLLFLAFASLFSPLAAMLLLASMGLYMGITLAVSASLAAKHGQSYFPALPPIFWTIHVALGWGFLEELVRTLLGKGPKFN